MQSELKDKNQMMQDISTEISISKQSEFEQKNEIDKLKNDIKKVEGAKAELDRQLKGMEMVLAKNAEMIIMF